MPSGEAVVAHLLADLRDEARRRLGDTGFGSSGAGGIHDELHARLSAAARELRSTLAGIPLHAGGCRLADGRGLLIAGPTGAGKSTLVGLLARERAASAISDDTVWLQGGQVTGIGAPIAIRAGSPLWSVARSQWYADGESVRLLVRSTDLGGQPARLQVHVDLLAFPQFDAQSDAASAAIGAAEAFCRLAPCLLRACSDDELLELARLTGGCHAVTLRYPDPEAAIDLIEVAMAGGGGAPADVRWLTPDELRTAGLRADVRGIAFDDDCALWRPALARLVHLTGWTGSAMCDNQAGNSLRQLGLMSTRGAS